MLWFGHYGTKVNSPPRHQVLCCILATKARRHEGQFATKAPSFVLFSGHPPSADTAKARRHEVTPPTVWPGLLCGEASTHPYALHDLAPICGVNAAEIDAGGQLGEAPLVVAGLELAFEEGVDLLSGGVVEGDVDVFLIRQGKYHLRIYLQGVGEDRQFGSCDAIRRGNLDGWWSRDGGGPNAVAVGCDDGAAIRRTVVDHVHDGFAEGIGGKLGPYGAVPLRLSVAYNPVLVAAK